MNTTSEMDTSRDAGKTEGHAVSSKTRENWRMVFLGLTALGTISLAGAAFYATYYTVRPVYQKLVLEEQKAQLSKHLEVKEAELAGIGTKLTNATKKLEIFNNTIKLAETDKRLLQNQIAELEANKRELEANKRELEANKRELEANKRELEAGEKETKWKTRAYAIERMAERILALALVVHPNPTIHARGFLRLFYLDLKSIVPTIEEKGLTGRALVEAQYTSFYFGLLNAPDRKVLRSQIEDFITKNPEPFDALLVYPRKTDLTEEDRIMEGARLVFAHRNFIDVMDELVAALYEAL